MAIKTNIRKWVITTIWVGLSVCILIFLIAAIQKNNNTVCKKIELKMEGNEEHKFLTESDILTLVDANEILNNKGIKDIDIRGIEEKLAGNIWIEKVEIFFDKSAVLHIRIAEREPICRVFRQDDRSFYMDKNFFLLPLSTNYSANVPVFTGFSNRNDFNKKDSSALEGVLKMASYINRNSFWKAQIQQINIIQNDNFEIIPTIGNHIIQFGDTVDTEQKFKKLFTFYKTVSTKVGFDKYAVLNVQFKNQLVATNNRNAFGIDTVKANEAVRLLMRNSLDSALRSADTLMLRTPKDSLLKTNLPPVAKQKADPGNISVNKQTGIKSKPPPVIPKPKATMPKRNKSNKQNK